ncbi:MAG: hypothetical protein HYY46_20680 [Deltaproteobacteria bacterium]|nr:hypothetical protein [Deltaproteobacteria bacterium]
MRELTDGGKQLKQRSPTRTLRKEVKTKPIFSSVPLISYKYDPQLARNEKVAVTVKTTLQIHKNDRQEEQMKRANPDVFGREAARSYVYGLVAAYPLSHERLNWTLAEAEWTFSALEPYAVDTWGNKMALAGANYVCLINMDTGEVRSYRDPWLSQAHTVQFSADGKRLLVTSAGFDVVLEFDTETGQVVWQWFAWDHGFDRSKLGHYVVRSREKSETLKARGEEVLFVDNPANFEFGIPTRLSPAHINSARYDVEGKILVSLFHQGAGIVVDKATGEGREVISGLVNPHKFSRRNRGGYFISDTRRGKLIFVDENYRPTAEIVLAGTPGIERSALLSEFLQNATELKDDLFACVDIHRNSLWLIDVKRRRYRGVKFPVEWSMHDVTGLSQEHQLRIGRLVGAAFGKIAAFAGAVKVIHHFSSDGREITNLALDAQGRNRELDVEM